MVIQRRLDTAAQRGDVAPPSGVERVGGPLIPACASDPDRWTTTADEGAKVLCRACPRRWPCARDACSTPGAEGVWAGIAIPSGGRARQFALKQLRSLAENTERAARSGAGLRSEVA